MPVTLIPTEDRAASYVPVTGGELANPVALQDKLDSAQFTLPNAVTVPEAAQASGDKAREAEPVTETVPVASRPTELNWAV